MTRRVKIFRWRRQEAPDGNFGDEITIDLLRRLFSIEAEPVAMPEAELIATGSILDAYDRQRWRRRLFAYGRRHRWASDLHVWGAGAMHWRSSVKWPQRLHYHAVRGELTAARAGLNGVVLGDPGILVSRLMTRPADRVAVALVPHWSEWEHARALDLPKSWILVHPEQPAMDAVAAIASAELVVSSSLHGLITADAFDIPAIWAAPNERIHWAHEFKFKDHASSRRRPFNEPVAYREVLAMCETKRGDIATTPGRKVAEWQDDLVKAFPFVGVALAAVFAGE